MAFATNHIAMYVWLAIGRYNLQRSYNIAISMCAYDHMHDIAIYVAN